MALEIISANFFDLFSSSNTEFLLNSGSKTIIFLPFSLLRKFATFFAFS
jgi:hypothetical protein